MPRATIQVPRPCAEDWARMTPTAQGRYCAACQHTVTDFTQRTDAEILALLRQAAGGRVCGRFRAEQLSRELVHAPAAAPRWRAWLLTAAALWGVPAAAQGLRSTHSGGPLPAGGNAPVTQQSAPTGVLDRPAAETRITLGEPVMARSAQLISGQVVDKTGLGIPGATVLVKGTTDGTSTDSEGRFVLSVTKPHATLMIASIGYETSEVTADSIGALRPLQVTLQEDVKGLAEVVFMGAISYRWYSPRGLWYTLRSLPRRLTGR